MNVDFDSNWAEATSSAGHSATVTASPAAVTPAAVPMKQIVTIRLDVDTLAWFKAAGPGYQTRINQLLRDHMEAQQAQDKT